MVDLNEEGESLAHQLIESFRVFVSLASLKGDGGSKERLRSTQEKDTRWDGASNDLLNVMKKIFVVNPALKSSAVTSSGGCSKHRNPSLDKAIQGRDSKRIDRLENTQDGSELNSVESEIKAIDSLDGRKLGVEGEVEETNMAGSHCKPPDGSRDICSDVSNNLMESADSGVFVTMGAPLYGVRESENHSLKDDTANELSEYSFNVETAAKLPHSSSVDKTMRPVVSKLHLRSRIPVSRKSKGNTPPKEKKKVEKSWMESLQESISKFRDYEFGGKKNWKRPSERVYDRSRSAEPESHPEANVNNHKHRILKSTRSMISLNQCSPRFDESASFWKHRTSLERNFSKYVEDEKQVLKDVKCDREFAEANDFAKRRLCDSKRKKSLSLFDISISEEVESISDGYRKGKSVRNGLLETRNVSASRGKSASRPRQTWTKLVTQKGLVTNTSKIPVFIRRL